MTDKESVIKDHERKQRAIDAKTILENPAYIAAVTAVRDGLHTIWESSANADSEGREQAYKQLMALKAIENHLKAFVSDGTIVEHRQQYLAALTRKH